MDLLITELSKYIICLLMLVYTAESFLVLLYPENRARTRRICTLQLIWIFALQALFYAQIIANTGEITYLYYYAIQLVVLILTPVLFTRLYPDCNRMLMNNMCMLLMIGMTVILRIDPSKAVRQLGIVTVSIGAGLVLIRLIRRVIGRLPRLWIPCAVLGIGALAVVLILGSTTYGSRVSYSILGLSFQPAEFVKILFVLFLAGALYRNASLPRIFLTGAVAAAHVLILVLSRDLGSALIFFVVYVFMIFAATGKARWLFAGLVLMALASVAAYFLFGHVRARVLVFVDPWSVIDSTGYQITQSLFSITGGLWFGRGFFNGLPRVIPVVEKDLIFSAIAEELGLIFALLMLLVCLATFLTFLRSAHDTEHAFRRLVMCGIGVTYIFQVFLTVGGGAKFIPLTGVTLPLVSYGGSSVLAAIMMFSLYEGISGEDLAEDGEDVLPDTDAGEEALPAKRKRPAAAMLAVGTIFTVLFLSMSVFIGSYAFLNRRSFMSNSYNRRQEYYARNTLRGSVLAADGTVLAYSEEGYGGSQTRVYPYGEVFAHAVGYAVRDKAGVEAYANYDLLNTGAGLKDKMDMRADGVLFPGNSVSTTFDPRLQQTAYDALGDRKGAVIVTRPKTGEILALVSKPAYDPAVMEEVWEELTQAEEESTLINRATQGLYPTGSTFKIITTLAYLRAHPADYEAYGYNCYGSFSSAGETVHCVGNTAHGQMTLAQSFAVSCNSSFVNMGLQTDRADFRKTLDDLYFGKSLPCDLVYNRSATADPATATVPQMMQLSIGQGETAMTPLHLHMIASAVANEGVMLRPYMISEVRDLYGKSVVRYGAKEAGSVMTKEEAGILTKMMREVVQSGTGYALSGKPYEAAGKTGSAEHGEQGALSAHAWFTGFAPASDPEICVTIIVEDAGSSSTVAVPVAAALFDAYFTGR